MVTNDIPVFCFVVTLDYRGQLAARDGIQYQRRNNDNRAARHPVGTPTNGPWGHGGFYLAWYRSIVVPRRNAALRVPIRIPNNENKGFLRIEVPNLDTVLEGSWFMYPRNEIDAERLGLLELN